ncbi:MAG: S41 family peptidase [bacterium]|nr:S41 family peptidase [bacterium]
MNDIRLKTAIFWIVVALAVGYGTGWNVAKTDISLDRNTSFFPTLIIRSKEAPQSVNTDFSRFWKVWELLQNEYVDKKAINAEKMVNGAISGMVQAVGDPYTTYFPPQDNAMVKEQLRGSFEGIGAELGMRSGKLVVIAPLDGSPASNAGVRAGDVIVKISSDDASGMSIGDAVLKIRGPKGTSVTLTLTRSGKEEPFDVSITRDTVRVKSVEVAFENDIAVIRLIRFGEQTNREWDEAVEKITSQGLKGIVLDLRNNTGGILESGVYVASEFLSSGNVVLREDGSGQRSSHAVDGHGRLRVIPLVVIINKGSASASEIVAGALQEAKRAVLVGETSFGKGSVQKPEILDGGAGVHITIEHWLLPSGRSIHDKGLTPDVEVKQNGENGEDTQRMKAIELVAEKIASS